MRRDLEAARRRLTWFGAQRWQLWLLGGVESERGCGCRVVLGWIVGIAVAGVVAGLAGAPVVDVLGESVLSPVGLGVAVAAAVVAAVLVFVTVSLPQREGARIGALDLLLRPRCSSSLSRSPAASLTKSSSRAGRERRSSCSCSPGSSRSPQHSSSRGSFRRWRDSGPTAGAADFRLGLRPSDWRAGRALRSRRSRSSPSRSPSRSLRRGIGRRSCAAIESRLRSRCRTTSSSARTSGTWCASSMPHRSSASTSSSARAAPRARCCG